MYFLDCRHENVDKKWVANKKFTSTGYSLTFRETALFLLYRPDWVKYLIMWARSRYSSGMKDELPWLTFKAIDVLQSYLKHAINVFEYGSGGSTLFLAKRVKNVTSVEHDEEWYEKVKAELTNRKITNCNLLLKKPRKSKTKPKYGLNSYSSKALRRYAYYRFNEYVKSIDSFPDSFFDLVIVDGRARISCIKHAARKIKIGGIVVLDNSERPRYQEGLDFLSNSSFKRTDYFGFGPYLTTFWKTSMWVRI